MTNTSFSHIFARRYMGGRAWLIREEALDIICGVIDRRMHGVQLSAEEIQAAIGARRSNGSAQMGSVAVIPICGVIDQKIGSMTDISGGTTVDGLMKSFRNCLNDPAVTAIVFDIDSPGGSVDGVPEAAAEIFAARGTKPILSIADNMMASAAYYLGCAADEVVCMPSGQVGSVGVLAAHDDYSQQNEMIGYKPTVLVSKGAQYKAEFSSDTPLGDDARNYLQAQLDTMEDDFHKFVAKARGLPVDTVRADFGKGRMLLAKAALAAKMIDRIDTLDATIARAARMAKSSASAETETLPVTAQADAGQADDTETLDLDLAIRSRL
jgi:signal peptide peptidase SppA